MEVQRAAHIHFGIEISIWEEAMAKAIPRGDSSAIVLWNNGFLGGG